MEIRIKLSGNKVWELNNFGDIKSDILEDLYKHPKVTKKSENVTKSIENMLYDGQPVSKVEYDALTNQARIHLI